MNDEFNKSQSEYNSSVSEYKKFEAIEYTPISEIRKDVEEVGTYKEDSTSEDKIDVKEFQKKLDQLKDIEKNDMSQMNQSNTTEFNGTEVEGGALAESTTANIVATSTSLAGGVTVLSAAAVVAGSMAGGLMEAAPEVLSCNIETGADYLIYEMELDKIKEGAEYKIRVSNNSFSVEYPITEPGTYKELVTGLTPLMTYTIELIGDVGVFDEYIYYTQDCYTNVDEMPKALFDFKPIIDEDLHVYSLGYDIYFSNYYNVAKNPTLEIYSESEMLIEAFELDEENFFRGVIEDLPDKKDLNARVYAEIQGEKQLISEYGYKTEYPEGFVSYDKTFVAKYNDLTKENISYTYDINKGNILNINTDFSLGMDKNEYLRFDIYDSDNELIKTVNSTDETLEIILDPMYTNVNIKLTEVKEKDSGEIEEFGTKELEYTFTPLFGNIDFYIMDNIFSLNVNYLDETDVTSLEFAIQIVKKYKDGTTSTIDQTFTGSEYSNELELDENKTQEDLESVDVIISYGDIKLYKTNIIKPEITYSDFDVSDAGEIILGYDIKEIEGYELDNVSFTFYDATEITLESTLLKDNLVIEELSKNYLSGEASITYKDKNGETLVIKSSLYKDLAAEVEVVGYASMHNSMCYYNLDFITTLNGKEINMNLDIVTDKTVQGDNYEYTLEKASIDEAKYDNDGKFYSIRVPDKYGNYVDTVTTYQISYVINTEGFDNKEKTITLTEDIYNNTDNSGHERNNYSIRSEVNYLKEKDSNGLYNYYFRTGFSSENSSIYQRIFYSYVKDGNRVYGYTPYFTSSTYVIEGLEDYDYEFDYRVFYLASDTYYYENDLGVVTGGFNGVKEISNANIFISSSDMIYEANGNTNIEFTLDNECLSPGNNITVLYDGESYEIEVKNNTQEDTGLDSISYEYDGDTYSYYVNIMQSDNVYKKFNVSLSIKDKKLSTTDVSLDIPYSPSTFISNSGFDITTEVENMSLDICKYSGVYDDSNVYYGNDSVSYSDGVYAVSVGIRDFSATDSRDYYRFEYYYNDELVASSNYYVEIPAIYDEVTAKLVLYREANDYTTVFKTIELGTITLEKKYYVDSVTFNNATDSYTFDAEINSEVEFSKIEYTEYYLDGTKTSKNSTSTTIDERLADMSNISKIEFNIYYNTGSYNVLAGKYVYNSSDVTGFNLGDVELDSNMNLLLNYSTELTDIAGIQYLDTVVESVSSSGTLQLDTIISNQIDFMIGRQYTDSYGNTVNLSYMIEKVLDVEIDTDYYLATTWVSSESYTNDARTLQIHATPNILGKEISLNELRIELTESGSSSDPTVLATEDLVKYLENRTQVLLYESTNDSGTKTYSLKYHYLLPNGDIYDNNGSDFEYIVSEDDILSHEASISLINSIDTTHTITRNGDNTINLSISELRSDDTIELADGEYITVDLKYTEDGETKYISKTLEGTSCVFENILDTTYEVIVTYLYKDTNGNIRRLGTTSYSNINTSLKVIGHYENSSSDGNYTAYFYFNAAFLETPTFTIKVNDEVLTLTHEGSELNGTLTNNSNVTYKLSMNGTTEYYINFTGLALNDVVSITVSEGNSTGSYVEKTYSETIS